MQLFLRYVEQNFHWNTQIAVVGELWVCKIK